MDDVFWYRNAPIGLDLHQLLKSTPKTGNSRRARGRRSGARAQAAARADTVVVRPVRRDDLAQVVAIDATVTGLEKRDYWRSIHRRYGDSARAGRQFLVADDGERVVGFIIGEVRDWEFGSAPCGWVFAIDVKPDARLSGIGTRLLEAICAGFRRAGVRKVRTMLGRDNTLILSFFRSQGMMAGPFIPLEMDLEP
jgi:ribosomal protein S18 acetylase RimI-like enzyme